MVCTICKRITCPCWTHIPVRINGKIVGWEKRTMTYPPEDFYNKDNKKKSVIFSKYFLVALIVTVIVYYCIDILIQWLR